MSIEKDILSNEGIKQYLNDENFEIKIFDELASTNSAIRNFAENGAKEGLVVIAKKQTEGRGRMGRRFQSPENCGIYMSLLLKPKLPPEKTLFITCAAAVAVCKSLEKISGKKMGIKWVNDVFCGEKKLCGILTEAVFCANSNSMKYAVLGIGINVYEPQKGFSEDIKDIAGAVFSNDEAAKDIKNKIAAGVLNSFWEFYKNPEEKSFLEEYKQRSVILGSKINVIKGTSVKNAVALEIDDECRLVVKYENNETEALFSGEVSIKKQGVHSS